MSLEALYKDPKFGLVSKDKFIQNLYSAGLASEFSRKEINEFFDNMKTGTLISSRPSKIRERLQIVAMNNEIGQYQADLIDWSKYAKKNDGYKWILTVLDIASRKAWAIPLKDKTGKTVAEALEPILRLTRKKEFRSFISDSGSEFIDKSTVTLLKKLGYRIRTVDPAAINSKSKVGIVERFNRTMQEWLRRYAYMNESYRYIDALQPMIDNYNNSKHSTTKETPNDIWRGRAKSKQVQYAPAAVVQKYAIGTRVHYLRKQKTFEKRSGALNFSEEALPIKMFFSPKYQLSNGHWFYTDELIPEVKDKPKAIKIAALNKEIKKDKKFDKELKADLGVTVADPKYQKLIVQGPRKRTKTTKYGYS